jgi:hypothetical protein
METAAEYQTRIKGYVGDRDPLTILRSTADDLRRLVAGRSEDVLKATPAAGKWSIVQILAHLADATYVAGYRVRAMLGQPGTAIQGFDQDAWVREMRYASVPVEASLQSFAAVRQANLPLIERLTPEDWERYGIHSERGRETVRDIVTLDAGHDINHINQIRRILG